MTFEQKLKAAYGAGPIMTTVYDKGVPGVTHKTPAPTVESVKEKFKKRGPKPGVKRANSKQRWHEINLRGSNHE